MTETCPEPARTEPPLLLNYKQAANLLGICERKLWELANRGDIKAIRIDSAVRFNRRTVEQYIEKLEGRGR